MDNDGRLGGGAESRDGKQGGEGNGGERYIRRRERGLKYFWTVGEREIERAARRVNGGGEAVYSDDVGIADGRWDTGPRITQRAGRASIGKK